MSPRALLVSSASLLLAASSLWADPVSRMYDLRDLAAVLPAPAGSGSPMLAHAGALPGEGGVPVLKDIPIIRNFFTGVGSAALGEGQAVTMGTNGAPGAPEIINEAGQTPTDELVGKLTNLCSLSVEELVDHIYIVDGEEEGHVKFAAAIENVRGLYQDRVMVEISCYEIDAAQAVAIGAPAPKSDAAPAMHARSMVVRKSTARLDALRSTTYIARWTPIVADGSVGLEPGTSTVTDGVSLAVHVGGGDSRARVSVHGLISKAEIEAVKVPTEQAAAATTSISAGGPLLTIGLPHIERRAIDTDVTIELGRPILVATVPGFREGRQICVTVTVKPE